MKLVRSAILIGFLIGGVAFDVGVQAQTTAPSTCPVGSYKATSCTKDIITYSGGMNPGASGVRKENVPDVCKPTESECRNELRTISCRTGCTQVQETTTNGQNAVTTVGQACRIMGGREIPDRIEGECSKLGQNACRSATPKNGVGCQWVTVTDNNDGGRPETSSFCAPTWSQCKQYCFGDNKGSTNLNCFNTQNECKVERDKTVARDGQGVVFGSILLAGQSPALNFENCGELRSTNAAACMQLNSLCEPKDATKEICEAVRYPGKPNDVVCQWKQTGAGAAMCFPKLEIGTGLSCGDTCLVDTDAGNEQRCYPYKQTCEAQLRNGSVKYSSGPDSKLEFPVCGFADPQALAAAGILSRGTGGPTSTQRLSGFLLGDITFKPIYADPSSGLGGVGEGLYENVGQSGSFFQKMYQVAIWFAVILAVIFMVKAGFVMATSAGNESRYSSAKGTLRNAVVGLLLAVGSYVILNTINPAILNLSILKPVTIATREAAEERLVDVSADGISTSYEGAQSSPIPPGELNQPSENIPCPSGTTDKGVQDGYIRGNVVKIRICDIPGYPSLDVNARIAANVLRMVKAAEAAGNPMYRRAGGFRTMQEQIEARRNNRCSVIMGPSDAGCNKPTARPGFSNHQMGYAIDTGIDCRRQNVCSPGENKLYDWLMANAQSFHQGYVFKKLRTESWHFSVDGK